MKLGIIGLGKMGHAIADRAVRAGHSVFGYNHSPEAIAQAKKIGVTTASSLEQLAKQAEIIWLMVPPTAVDGVIAQLKPMLTRQHIVIDGGNSFFKDSMARAEQLGRIGVPFLDVGTSGGLHGKEIGFCLMIGGQESAYVRMLPLFESIAAKDGYAHVGPSGAGHYVKMVHNGIEYALMQAYAEGFHLLKHGQFKDLNLAQISNLWNHGSIIRSWLLELTHAIFVKDQDFSHVSGKVSQTGMGAWTVQEAKERNIPVRLIEDAVNIRQESQQTCGDYATKLVALLRQQFGGHPIQSE
jgi:6-phosphogluconate dehydrogenase